jgi:hypothetical protein
MEPITLSLPSGLAAVLKPHLTGREKRALRAIFLKDVEVGTGADGQSVTSGMKASAIEEGENYIIGAVVVSLDGKTENILERVLDLAAPDYDCLMKVVNDITAEKKS